jgi:hypothetical protein
MMPCTASGHTLHGQSGHTLTGHDSRAGGDRGGGHGPDPIGRTTLRSWTRRLRLGRLEPLDVTAARVLTQVQNTVAHRPGLAATPPAPVLVQDGIPRV